MGVLQMWTGAGRTGPRRTVRSWIGFAEEATRRVADQGSKLRTFNRGVPVRRGASAALTSRLQMPFGVLVGRASPVARESNVLSKVGAPPPLRSASPASVIGHPPAQWRRPELGALPNHLLRSNRAAAPVIHSG